MYNESTALSRGKEIQEDTEKAKMLFKRESLVEKMILSVCLWKQIILSLAIYTSQEVIYKALINILKRKHTGKPVWFLIFFAMVSSEKKAGHSGYFSFYKDCKIFSL